MLGTFRVTHDNMVLVNTMRRQCSLHIARYFRTTCQEKINETPTLPESQRRAPGRTSTQIRPPY